MAVVGAASNLITFGGPSSLLMRSKKVTALSNKYGTFIEKVNFDIRLIFASVAESLPLVFLSTSLSSPLPHHTLSLSP